MINEIVKIYKKGNKTHKINRNDEIIFKSSYAKIW